MPWRTALTRMMEARPGTADINSLCDAFGDRCCGRLSDDLSRQDRRWCLVSRPRWAWPALSRLVEAAENAGATLAFLRHVADGHGNTRLAASAGVRVIVPRPIGVRLREATMTKRSIGLFSALIAIVISSTPALAKEVGGGNAVTEHGSEAASHRFNPQQGPSKPSIPKCGHVPHGYRGPCASAPAPGNNPGGGQIKCQAGGEGCYHQH